MQSIYHIKLHISKSHHILISNSNWFMVNASSSIHITFEKWCVEHQFHIFSVTSKLCFHLVFSTNQITLCPPKTLDLLGLRLHVPLNRSFLSEMTDWKGTNEVWTLFVISAYLKIKFYNAHINIPSIYFIYIIWGKKNFTQKLYPCNK